MAQDKQLSSIRLKVVLKKQRLGQALNAKEFAVLAGVSYSTARQWFHAKGFPVLNGLVFWQDFITWRHRQTGITVVSCDPSESEVVASRSKNAVPSLPEKARKLLAEV